jgi:threonine dehydrogenase-like Zn-dependent dehydrogenase
MRALRIDGPMQVELVDVPRPEPAPGEILVKVAFASICATDRKLSARGPAVPRIPGHEVSGWSEDGTPVGIHTDLGCGTCRHCRAGFENRCRERVSIGLDRHGGMAEWVTVPEAHVLPLGDLDLAVAATLEPLGCCVHAVSLIDVPDGAPAVVVGGGPMGILATWALQARGARVAVCDTVEAKRRTAAELGADAVLGPESDPAVVLGDPPLVGIVTAPGQEPLRWALERMDVGGTLHTFAGSSGANEVDANLIHYRHLALVGSTGSTMRDYRQAYEMVASDRIPLGRLPRTLISLEEAVSSLRTPGVPPDGRQVIDMGRSSRG